MDVFHDDEIRAAFLAPVVDCHDIGMIEVGRGLRLTTKPFDERRFARVFRKECFECDPSIE